MREVNFLHYIPGNSLWHRHDPRMKLLEMCLMSLMALAGSLTVLAAVGGTLLILHAISGSRLKHFVRPLCFWALMGIFFVIGGGLAIPEPPLEILGWISPFSTEGMIFGLVRALRLLAVLLAGQLLSSTSDPADLADGIRRITVFLPRQWSAALATAISLTISFIPRFLDEAALVSDAALSRCIAQRKSIFRRAFSMAMPLAEATLRRADLCTDALLSRCYTSNPTPPDLSITRKDILLFAASLALPLALSIVDRWG